MKVDLCRVPEGPRKCSPSYLRVASSVSCPQNLLWPSLFSPLCLHAAFSRPLFLEPQLPAHFFQALLLGEPLGSDSILKDFHILLNILTETDR